MRVTKRQAAYVSDGDCKRSKHMRSSTTERPGIDQAVSYGARRAVFEDANLIEKILLCLPAKTIFGSQSVCRELHTLVASSTKIQKELWHQRLENEPLAVSMREPKLDISSVVLSFSPEEAPNTIRYSQVKLNSILSLVTSKVCIKSGRRMQLSMDNMIRLSIPRQIRGAQAWHHTQLSDPPTKSATILLFWQICRGVNGYAKRTVTHNYGLTFGDIVGAALFRKEQRLGDYDWYVEDVRRKPARTQSRFKKPKPSLALEPRLVDVLDVLEERYHSKALLSRDSYITIEEMV